MTASSTAPHPVTHDVSRIGNSKASSTSPRATIAAVLITKNESHQLEPCLKSLVDWVDEIVVLDSGSTDTTQDLAKRYGARVFVREDWDGFGTQRQRAQKLATSEYILAIDADERISPELRKSIETVLEHPDAQCLYQFVRQNAFLDKDVFHNGWRREKIVRLYCRQNFTFNDRAVHESVDSQGIPTKILQGFLIHDACRNYEYYLEKHLAYAHSWARNKAESGRRGTLFGAVLHGLTTFIRLYVLQGGFLDGRHGFLFAAHLSQYSFNKYAALWHYGREHNKKSDCSQASGHHKS